MNFQAYAVPWLERRRAAGLRSAGDYESILRNHLLPRWARLDLADIGPKLVRAWVDDLRAGPLAPRSVRNVYGLLRNILADAIADELLDRSNPCCLRGSALPPNEHRDPDFREKHVFTREEMLQIVSAEAVPLRWRSLYMTLFATGARIGEVLALEWPDVKLDDESTPRIRVARSYNSKTNVVGPTKTKVARIVPVHARTGGVR